MESQEESLSNRYIQSSQRNKEIMLRSPLCFSLVICIYVLLLSGSGIIQCKGLEVNGQLSMPQIFEFLQYESAAVATSQNQVMSWKALSFLAVLFAQ